MNMIHQSRQRAELEQVLLSYVEMCYSVAFALTHNPRQAQELTKYAVTWVWRIRNNIDGRPTIKQELLKALRERFLLHYRQYPQSNISGSLRSASTCGADLRVQDSASDGYAENWKRRS